MPPAPTTQPAVPPHPVVRIGETIGHLIFHPLPAGSAPIHVAPAHVAPVAGELLETKAIAAAFVEQLEANPRLARRFLAALFAGIKS